MENEYGSNPACDKVYLETLTKQFRDILGQEILLYTVDGPGIAVVIISGELS